MLLCGIAGWGGGGASLLAQASTEPVSVRRVTFNTVGARGGDGWLEMSVLLSGGPALRAEARNANFNDRVKVRVLVSFQLSGGGDATFEFYRAEATLVSLERGREVTVPFYLPPEIVKRDRLGREPFAWLVELEVDGQPLPGQREHVSRALNNVAVIDSFRSRVAADAPRNDGLLVPVYRTPFYGPDAMGRGGDQPSYVRREAAP